MRQTIRRSRQSGDSKIGCVIWLLILASVAMILWEAVPVKIRTAEFYDYLDEQAKFSQRLKLDFMKREILRRARDLQIPITKKDLIVEKRGGRIRMECSYMIPLEFPFYTYEWEFHHLINEPIFIW